MNDERAGAILDHWFLGEKVDESSIASKFAGDLERARRGELDGWTAEPESCLALVLVLDQVSRHVHRDSDQAFASDAKAQATVLVSIARGLDAELEPIQRAYFYLPLMHSEDEAVQQRAVELYGELGFEHFYESAVRHRDIIERFGRFPHRNALLGRESTPEELAFLQEPGTWRVP
jgi:uncharacterized protein (DUF924 family)